MGVKTIRVIAFLDIIIAAGFIAQQITYTADQYNSHSKPKPNITQELLEKQLAEPPKPKCRTYVVFPTGQLVVRSAGTTSREPNPAEEHISKGKLWLILSLVVSTSFFSILSSMAVIHTAKLRFHPSSEKFTIWIQCYAVSLLATIIVAGVGYAIPSVIISCIIFVSLRASLAVVLSEEFVCMALKATTLQGYKNDTFKKLEAKKRKQAEKLAKKAAKKEKKIEKEHNPTTFLVMEYPSIKEQSHNLMV